MTFGQEVSLKKSFKKIYSEFLNQKSVRPLEEEPNRSVSFYESSALQTLQDSCDVLDPKIENRKDVMM